MCPFISPFLLSFLKFACSEDFFRDVVTWFCQLKNVEKGNYFNKYLEKMI